MHVAGRLLDVAVPCDSSQSPHVAARLANPVPFAYVSTDRSRASVMRTLEDLGIDPTQLPVIAAVEKESTSNGGYTVDWLFGLVKKEAPKRETHGC